MNEINSLHVQIGAENPISPQGDPRQTFKLLTVQPERLTSEPGDNLGAT